MTTERTPNPHREAARAIAKRIAAMTAEEKAALIARFPAIVTIEGRALSGPNTMLVAMQKQDATIVGGFRQWLKAGRCVKKGEHGLFIWIPSRKGEADAPAPTAWIPQGNGTAAIEGSSGDETRFFLAPVFDISQTAELEAKPDDAEQGEPRTAEAEGFTVGGWINAS